MYGKKLAKISPLISETRKKLNLKTRSPISGERVLIYNKFHDNKIRKQVNEIEAERDEKQNLYNEWYSYIDSAFQKGEFSITKDCWHSGNKLLKYYNDNRAFSFKEALYYVEKRRDREAMENGLRNAYSAGYSSGSSDGYNSGYNNGYNSGYHTGKRK